MLYSNVIEIWSLTYRVISSLEIEFVVLAMKSNQIFLQWCREELCNLKRAKNKPVLRLPGRSGHEN